MARLGAAEHRLARDAGHIRILAADAQHFDQCDRATAVRNAARDPFTRRARTQHHDIESLRRACIPTPLPQKTWGDEVSGMYGGAAAVRIPDSRRGKAEVREITRTVPRWCWLPGRLSLASRP